MADEALKEVELLGQCTPHASLLPLLGYCVEPGRPSCLVYPLCNGGTLEDRLKPHASGAQSRLTALGWASTPATLSWGSRLTILRDVARALEHLHGQRLLHGDVKPSNILLDAGGGAIHARLADFGLARMAKEREQAAPGASVASVSAVKGTAAFLDPIYLQSGVSTELTDAFALGVSVLMTLTGLPTSDIKQRCRLMLKFPDTPDRWLKPGVPDEAAGKWDGASAAGLAEISAGLTDQYEEDRMPFAEALQKLEAMAVAVEVVDIAAATVGEEEERCCIICEAAPREVRFACGHALVCRGCLPVVVNKHRQCPSCGVAFGAHPVAEQGDHVRAAPTFVLPA